MRHPKFWFTTANGTRFFCGDFNLFPSPVSHDPSRKNFLAKLLGLAAVAGIAPRLFAKSASSVIAPGATPSAAPKSFTLQSESRAVSRRADSV